MKITKIEKIKIEIIKVKIEVEKIEKIEIEKIKIEIEIEKIKFINMKGELLRAYPVGLNISLIPPPCAHL